MKSINSMVNGAKGAAKRTRYGAMDGMVKKDKNPESFGMFMVVLCVCIFSFLTFTVYYNSFIFFHRNAVAINTILAIAGCAVLIKMKEKNAYNYPLGLSLLGTILCAALAGMVCYDQYGYFSYLYSNTRTYHNVVASANAAAVADAGRLTFAREAHVDVDDGVGYAASDGVRYCVAPVRDLVETRVVEFWAVGFGCCAWTGQFTCDQASDASAHSGIVVMDSLNMFGVTQSNRDRYDKARRKAEALFGMIPAISPVYVRWVSESNLDMLIQYYTQKSWLFIVFVTVVYTAVAAGPIFLLINTLYPGRAAASAAKVDGSPRPGAV